MNYIKWIAGGAAAGLVVLGVAWMMPDLQSRLAVVAASGAGLAGLIRWLLKMVRVEAELSDAPKGKLIRVIDVPGTQVKFLVVGVWFDGALLYLGYVEFR